MMDRDLEALEVEIAHYMAGTCNDESRAADRFEVEVDFVVEACVKNGVDLCDSCQWWQYASEFVDTGEHELLCRDCYRERHGKDEEDEDEEEDAEHEAD